MKKEQDKKRVNKLKNVCSLMIVTWTMSIGGYKFDSSWLHKFYLLLMNCRLIYRSRLINSIDGKKVRIN